MKKRRNPVTAWNHQSVVSPWLQQLAVGREVAVLAVVRGELAHREEGVHDDQPEDAGHDHGDQARE
jgi:hypothetical protein